MTKLTPTTLNAKSSCPACGKSNRLNMGCLSDSDDRIYQTWIYCGHCGWDSRGGQPRDKQPGTM